MNRIDLQARLCLSGTDARAFDTARQYGLGYEIAAFCWAPMLENADILRRERERAAAMTRLWFHAPFAELSPCAIDPLVREVSEKRYRQSIALADSMGIRDLVIHDGFVPLVYYPEWFTEQSVEFWKRFLGETVEDVRIALENVMDPTPELLLEVVERVNDPRLGICLDIGHANTEESRVPPLEWVKTMQKRLFHCHIHNNRGERDLHAPLGEGVIPMEQVLDALLETGADVTIENEDCTASLTWLQQKGYITYD